MLGILPILNSDKVLDVVDLSALFNKTDVVYEVRCVRKLWARQQSLLSESLLNFIYYQAQNQFMEGDIFTEDDLENTNDLGVLIALQMNIHLGKQNAMNNIK